jgi:phosphoenolpyruvate carboxykinase (ATP)
MITAALDGTLDKANFEPQQVFGMLMPTECPGVPSEILNPRNTWSNKNEYDLKAKDLAKQFIKNFSQYSSAAGEETLSAAPRV